MKNIAVLLSIPLLILACQSNSNKPDPDVLKQEVIDAEHQFARAAKEKGVEAAFLEFADEDAVINRGEKIYRGKAEMKDYFSRSTLTDVVLEWEPEFVDVSSDGSMAYSYGPYTFKAKDKNGNPISAEGLFHTVWKKQADGSWKFVYD